MIKGEQLPQYIKDFFGSKQCKIIQLKPENIEVVEVSLINLCNLRCPMCLRQNLDIKIPPKHLDLNVLIRALDNLPNMKRIVFMGAVCEPTLYPNIFELIEYLNKRGIKIRISTNGSTNFDWKRLGEVLKPGDIVRFPVDGSTQELHSKYRVGSKLDKVLENHRIFKENSKAITIMQFIRFDYNETDEPNIIEMYKTSMFDILEMAPCYEPPSLNFKDIKPRKELQEFFKFKNKVENHKVLGCPEAAMNSIYINHEGVLVPCNEQEDFYLGKKVTNLYDNSIYECFDFLNSILANIEHNDVCLRACSKLGLRECFIYPITQYNRKSDSYDLVDFRECMLNR